MNSSDEAVDLLARYMSANSRHWDWDHVSYEGDRQWWRAEAREALVELTPIIAAAVRAEAVAEHDADLKHRIEVSTRIQQEKRVAYAERDEYHRNWQEAEKRATKAVAEEQRRVWFKVLELHPPTTDDDDRAICATCVSLRVHEAYPCTTLIIVAAGSAPVTTPEPPRCSGDAYNCPACGIGPVATPEPNDEITEFCCADDGLTPDGFTKVCQLAATHDGACDFGPVATPPAGPVVKTVALDELARDITGYLPPDRIVNTRPAPSQPVTCEHGWAKPHFYGVKGSKRPVRCPGPVPEPKEG